jgi:hypothetical protein
VDIASPAVLEPTLLLPLFIVIQRRLRERERKREKDGRENKGE